MAIIGLQDADQRKYLEETLAKMKLGTMNHRAALFAVVIGSMNVNEGNFVYFGKKFVKEYEKSSFAMANFIQQRLNQMGTAFVGAEAPEINEVNPEGKMISTNKFKGKVLLIDFWASWCGPCRKANPHVVSLYKKYHDKGFEILGVSLDQNKEKWVQAIQADGLTWDHVSDLGGWGSKWSKLYGVSSIPHTILLDTNGVIIGKQLQPAQLEEQLRKIYGE